MSKRVVGVCAVYRAFSTPSIVFGASTRRVKQALLKRALSEVPDKFISLCHPDDIVLFEGHSNILHSRFEQQMIADPPEKVGLGDIRVQRVRGDELELLNKFYVEHHAEAWVPIQFRAGPYYCVKEEGKIVSAAGVHLVTPRIAQLGNIVTDVTYRNRGLATACTSTLAADLASRGLIVSLFVRKDNAPAIHLYRELGFRKTREIAFVTMQKSRLT